MYDYTNLSYSEFEELCKDILQKKLGQPLRTFASGRDGGIDISGCEDTNKIVVQAKHYPNSEIRMLINSLKNEKAKVDNFKPEAYYICCSRELTPKNVEDIYRLYKDYMHSTKNILTKRDIDDFLQQPCNRDVLNIHFKLWMQSTVVLTELLNRAINIDSKIYLDDIKEMAPYYVSTQSYRKSLEFLLHKKIILITGNPGVGKSTLMAMLALYCVNSGYHLLYDPENDPNRIKSIIEINKEAKELVIMDDFLGQQYEDLAQVKENSLLSLIKYIARNENKILIMNTRIAVYCCANDRLGKLNLYFKNGRVHEIQVGDLSEEEKAEILCSHLRRNEAINQISHKYYENVMVDKTYQKIIRHRNYNPRVIEMAMLPSRLKTVRPDELVNSILAMLEHPEEIWRDTFSGMNQECRIFLFVMASLIQTTVQDDMLKECFWHRIRQDSLTDTTDINYEAIQKRLLGSFISFSKEYSEYVVKFLNPSVADYMASVLSGNESEREKLIQSAVYYEQLLNCCQKDFDKLLVQLAKLIKHHNLLQYQPLSVHNDWEGVVTLVIARTETCRKDYQVFLTNWLLKNDLSKREKCFNQYTFGDIAIELFHEPMYSFYELYQYISDEEAYLQWIELISTEDAIKITDHILCKLDCNAVNKLLPAICDQITDMMYEHIHCFDTESFCDERVDCNDYHDEMKRVRVELKEKRDEIWMYDWAAEDEKDECDEYDDMQSALIAETFYSMAVQQLRKELHEYKNMIANVAFSNLLSVPDPKEDLDKSLFYNIVEDMFESISHVITWQTFFG